YGAIRSKIGLFTFFNFSIVILVDLDALIPNICVFFVLAFGSFKGHNLVKIYHFFIKNTPKCSQKSEESENNSIKSKKSLKKWTILEKPKIGYASL
ncbi:hypothetical protein BpHYR1_040655, partial [Brachionus plicatilis]